VLFIPIEMPMSSLKHEVIKSLPDTLAEGKERVKLIETVDVTVDKIIDILIPETVEIIIPKTKRGPLGIPIPDGFEKH
jgi:hypothetical protein